MVSVESRTLLGLQSPSGRRPAAQHRPPRSSGRSRDPARHDREQQRDRPGVSTIFGMEITRIVAAMTEGSTIESFDERKVALREQIAEFGSGCHGGVCRG